MCPIYRFGNSMICYNNGKRATTKCKIKVHALQNFNPSNIKNSKHRVAQTIRTYACSICTLDCELSLFLPLQATRKKKFNSIEKGIWTLLKKVSHEEISSPGHSHRWAHNKLVKGIAEHNSPLLSLMICTTNPTTH